MDKLESDVIGSLTAAMQDYMKLALFGLTSMWNIDIAPLAESICFNVGELMLLKLDQLSSF